jgi:hypothetical protein
MHINHHESVSGIETYTVLKSKATLKIGIILFYLPETLPASPSNLHN